MAIVFYEWDFGDGTYSNEKDPVHVYTMPGVYSVVLTTRDEDGNETVSVRSDYITVYDWDYTDPDKINVSYTDKCYRHAVPHEPSQGVGWSEYTGEDWPFPEGLVGVCKFYNDNNDEVILVTDSITFKHYQLGKMDWWTDGSNESYGGSDYESEILFKEIIPPIGASVKLKHNESHLNVRPWLKSYVGAEGYTDQGFKIGFNSDLFLRIDSKPEDAVVAKRVPYKGQIVFDRHLESENIQPGVRLRTSPWRISRYQMFYNQIDTASAPPEKLMNEMTWQLALNEPLFWLPRDSSLTGGNLPYDYAFNNQMTGSYLTLVTGPDGYDYSAYALGSSDSLSITMSEDIGSGNFTIIGWFKSLGASVEIYKFSTGNLSISIDTVLGVLEYSDGYNLFEYGLSETFTNWVMITIVKNIDSLIVYENKNIVTTYNLLNDTVIYGGDLVLCNGQGYIYDCRIIPRAISYNVIEYLYNDVTENRGNVTGNVF